MHDNPQALPGRAFALTDHRVVALTGRDAAAFAQAQFMNDVVSLAPGHWQWSGWLTPKGRVLALFALLKFDDQTLWLLLPDADAGDFAGALQRFVFRAKVALAVRDDVQVLAAFAPPRAARGSAFAGDSADAIELDFSADGGPRSVCIVRRGEGDAGIAAGDPHAQRWTAFDLHHDLPRLPASQADHWTPQQLSLDRLSAFSVKKGCYPGQEIVARTHFLGKAKRGLALFACDAAVAPGTTVKDGADPLGEVVCQAEGVALAVVTLDKPAAAAHAGDEALRALALRPGLAR